MRDVMGVLSAIEAGDRRAAEELLPLVYDELRKLAAARLAHEAPGNTLSATALVHEAYVRLVDPKKASGWESPGHFFGAAAEAMRRILVNRGRDKKRLKRGGGRKRVDVSLDALALDSPPEAILALDEALARLAAEDERSAGVVKLRFFAGLSMEETARALGISRRTADRHWAFARAWLFKELGSGREPAAM